MGQDRKNCREGLKLEGCRFKGGINLGNKDNTLKGKRVHRLVETAEFCISRQNQTGCFKGSMENVMLRGLTLQSALALQTYFCIQPQLVQAGKSARTETGKH